MSEQRVPMPATSVAARCGEEGVIVEVKQNFLGNECQSLVRIDPQRFRVLQRRRSIYVTSRKRTARVRSADWKTEWIGKDGTVRADYCK